MRRFAPERAKDAERESREWKLICRECGMTRSFWDIGGLRYKAKSKGKRMRMACPSCGVKRWHDVERRET